MKRITFLILSVWLLANGCQQKATSPEKEETQNPETSADQRQNAPEVLKQYETYVAKLDSSQLENASKAAEKYKVLFNNQPSAVADSGFVLFKKFYEGLVAKVNEQHYQDTTNYLPLVPWPEQPSKPLPEKLKRYQAKLAANGFQIAMSEGDTYLQEDLDFIARHFYPYISPALKTYLTQLNKENKQGYAEDASLTISPTQFADRLLWREDFLQQHPNFILKEEVSSDYKSYLYFFLHGMDNTPVLSFNTKQLDPYFTEAYQYVAKKAPDSKTNSLVQPYFAALEKGDTAKAETLLKQYQAQGKIGY